MHRIRWMCGKILYECNRMVKWVSPARWRAKVCKSATVSVAARPTSDDRCRLLKIISLFCRIQSLLQGSFAEETYNLKEPTNWCDDTHVMAHTWWHTCDGTHVMAHTWWHTRDGMWLMAPCVNLHVQIVSETYCVCGGGGNRRVPRYKCNIFIFCDTLQYLY